MSLAELSAVEAPGSSVGSAGRAAAPLPSVLLDLWLRQKQPSGDLITPHAGNLTAPMRDEKASGTDEHSSWRHSAALRLPGEALRRAFVSAPPTASVPVAVRSLQMTTFSHQSQLRSTPGIPDSTSFHCYLPLRLLLLFP